MEVSISVIHTVFDRPGWRFVVRGGGFVHTSGSVWWDKDEALAAGWRWATVNAAKIDRGRVEGDDDGEIHVSIHRNHDLQD